MQRVKVGVAGVGKLGRYHALNYKQIPQMELAGLYDVNVELGKKVAAELEVPFFDKYEDLLQHVEAVSVAVPTSAHHRIATQALEQGIHVFVEKPIAATLDEADKLIQCAAQNALILQVGHIERFNPAFRSLVPEELQPMFIESHRLAPFNPRGTDVAVVLDLMIHDIDLILKLVKSPIKQINANGVAIVSRQEDIANARIQFANNCVANLTASRISLKKMRKMRLFQKDAYITMDFIQGVTEIYHLKSYQPTQPEEEQWIDEKKVDFSEYSPLVWGEVQHNGIKKRIVYEKRQPEQENALKLELQSFIKAIREKTLPPVTGEDGRNALKVAFQILEQIHSHYYEIE